MKCSKRPEFQREPTLRLLPVCERAEVRDKPFAASSPEARKKKKHLSLSMNKFKFREKKIKVS
jgi:hypothetical protein